MKLKKILGYVNVLYFILSIVALLKLVCFTFLIHSEMDTYIKGSEFVFNKYFLSYLFCAFSFYAIALVFNGKTSLKILIGLAFLLSFFMFFNLIYYRSFESFLSIYNLEQYKNFGIVGTSAFALVKVTDILLFIDPIVIMFTYKFWEKQALKQTEMSVRQRIIMAIYPIACVGLALNYNDFFAPRVTKVEAGAKFSIVGHQYHDLALFIKDSRSKVSIKDVYMDVDQWFKKKNENQGEIKDFGKYQGQNIIFLQVESLENFAINLKVEGQEVTPTLNKLLKNSYYFDNIIAQENGGNSSDADFMANTSLLPLKSGSVSYRFENNKYNSLPVILRNHNYSSHVIHSGQGYFWNKGIFLPNLGFDSYTDIEGMQVKEEDMFFMGLKDEEHLRQVADLASKQKDNFYLFTVTETSHTPFKMSEDMQYLKLSEEMNESTFGRYFQALRYTDEAINKFLTKLDQDGVLDNTMIVIYGDHEGIHKYNNDNVLAKQNDNYEDYANNSEIPVIIYHKKQVGQIISKVGGHIDIMPTVLSLLGIADDEYKDSAMGVNLLASKKGYAIDKNGIIYGDYSSKEDLAQIKKSIRISELIIKANYFRKDYVPSSNFSYNGNLKKED